jgi:RNA polymerase sigma-B factor
LARAIARRFDRGGRVPLEDLEQIAALGLLKALERFDPDKGTAFSSFAVPTIQGEIRRYYRDFTWAVRPPRALLEDALRLEREREHLTNELQRSPTAAELAARVGGTPEDVVDALLAARARSSDSLERPVDTDAEQGQTLADTLGQDDPGFVAAESAVVAQDLLGLLSERDALVVRLRFHDDLTQQEIGARVGCSQMHVSRILRKALATLQAAAADRT